MQVQPGVFAYFPGVDRSGGWLKQGRKWARRGVGLVLVVTALSACSPKFNPLYVQNADAALVVRWRVCAPGDGIMDLPMFLSTKDFDLEHAHNPRRRGSYRSWA